MRPRRLFCATSNPGKIEEFQQAAPPDLEIIPAQPLDCPETGLSFEQNAAQKAICYAARLQDLVFADDSGLEVAALGGAPGLHSARYAGPGATGQQNNTLLLENVRRVWSDPGSRPAARFVCVIAVALPDRLLATFRGAADGVILDGPAGGGGFGYDPLFYVPALGRTFAQLTGPEKFAHSHRGQAFRALLEWLRRTTP